MRQKLDQKLEGNRRLALAEAAEIAQTEGIEITSALQTLGYKVIWHGLNAQNAEVSNKK